jgi:hypothetical protein
MITPAELKHYEIDNTNIEAIIIDIDKEIKKNHGKHPYEEAILPKEYSWVIREEIARRYFEAGWKSVAHRTSSENGERPGLTHFKLSMKPIKWEE